MVFQGEHGMYENKFNKFFFRQNVLKNSDLTLSLSQIVFLFFFQCKYSGKFYVTDCNWGLLLRCFTVEFFKGSKNRQPEREVRSLTTLQSISGRCVYRISEIVKPIFLNIKKLVLLILSSNI